MHFFSARLRRSRLTALAGGLLAMLCASRSNAGNCDPMLAGEHVELERTINVRGGERIQQSVRLTAGQSVIVALAERGGDLLLEVSGARLIGRADSPIRRYGIQRVAFTTASAGDYTIALVGKDGAATRATATLRVLSVAVGQAESACFALHRQLSLADSAYAAGLTQSGQSGAATISTADNTQDAAALFKAAADGYQAIARRLASQPTSLLLAQSQLAASAALYQDLSEWATSREFADQAAASYAVVDDRYGKARAQAMSAAASMEIAMSLPAAPELAAAERPSSRALAQARAQLDALAAFHRGRGEMFDQALATNNIGLAFYMEDRNDEAIEVFRRALPLFAQLHELPKQAQVLSNIALAESELGRTAESSRHYDQLLALISATAAPKIYADALNNKALDEKVLGHFDNALSLFGRALDVARGLQDKWRESYGLNGIGEVYDLTGDQDQALNYYWKALAIRTREFDSRGRVSTLRDIANALRMRGDAAGAMAMHTEALTLEASASVRARLNIQVVKDLDALGRSTEALKLVEQVVREPSFDEVGHALALLERGRLRGVARATAAAEQDLRRAIDIFHRNELPADEHAAWVVLARMQRHSGAPVEAMRSIERALALSEEIRLQSANPEQRATLLQPLRPAFDLKISMLAERYLSTSADKGAAHRQALATEALSTAEQARARALADFQAFDANLPGVPAALLQRRRVVLQDLATKRNQLEARLDRGGTNDGLSVSLRAEIATSRRELSEIDAAIGAAAGRNGRKRVQGSAVLAGAFAQLPGDTAVVEYWLGTERALAWVLSSAGVTMVDLGSSDDIAAAVKAYHDSLRDMNTATEAQRLALSRKLYALAVAPLAPSIAGNRMLVFAPDGALHYTSFASLVTDAGAPARFLVQQHDVAVTPSITMLLAKERAPARADDRRSMLLVADPVYQLDDSRYSQVASGHADTAPPTMAQALQLRGGLKMSDLGRLPATATEAQGIAALWPAGQVDRLYGFDATREGFLARHLDRYRYIHVATHGLTDAEIPQLSSLVLSTRDRQGKSIEGRVLAADFMTTTLTADAVVLGACDTALGKNVAGEGLIGLRYVALARGAKAVVASLWPVPDRASAQLMTSFYERLVRDGQPVASALSGAMRSYIAGSGTDPAMWGAFAASTRTLGFSIATTRSVDHE